MDSPPGLRPDGKPFPVHSVADPDRVRGALLGLAAGDALGTTLEFSTPSCPRFPELARGPHRSIAGGGPFRVAAGQVTDDTQMAVCLTRSLMERGMLDVDDVAARYLEWRRHAFDVGAQTSAALDAIARGAPPAGAGRAVWLARGRAPAGNGSLMRTAPIGLFFAGQPDDSIKASLAESAITHHDPRCRLACAGFNAALAAAAHERAGRREVAAAAIHAIDSAARFLIEREPDDAGLTRAACLALRDDMCHADGDDPDLYGEELHLHRHAGFVRVAFRLAFWHLLHTESIEAALIDVANRGGDADTNAAITGALLGAVVGEQEIPVAWRQAVLSALADRPDDALATDYHPRALLALART